MQMKSHRRQFGIRPSTFGEQITADHIVAEAESSRSAGGDRDALLVYARATRYRACYPLQDKTAESATIAMRHFLHGLECRL